MAPTIREPMQQRAMKTKARIVEAGFKLFCEKGFHQTNTAQIAKAAGVSTGIVYNYFADKKAIFLAACGLYAQQVVAPMYDLIHRLDGLSNLDQAVAAILDGFVASHNLAKAAHEEMMAMQHGDADVARLFARVEDGIDQNLVAALRARGINPPNVLERVHLAHCLVEDYCHELLYHQRPQLDYAFMRETVIDLIKSLVLGTSRS